MAPASPNREFDPLATPEGVIYVTPIAQSLGLEMCNRDIRITTGLIDEASAIEDLKVDLTTQAEVSWNEAKLEGVYKLDSGQMVKCVTQAEASLSGVLTVVSYRAVDQVDGLTPIKYDIRGSAVLVDPSIVSLTGASRYSYRIYAIGAPDVHVVPGMANAPIRFFDSYLAFQVDGVAKVESSQATTLEPNPVLESLGLGLLAEASSVIKVYFYHPAGVQKDFVWSLMTFRDPGTF